MGIAEIRPELEPVDLQRELGVVVEPGPIQGVSNLVSLPDVTASFAGVDLCVLRAVEGAG